MGAEPRRIPSLDGLRAISICLVLISHIVGTRNSPIPSGFGDWLDLGVLGVRVFFVISGFLITGLLLAEIDKTNNINLPKFYFRRTFRIFPPYYFFILVVVLLNFVNFIQLAPRDVFHTLTYTSNYYAERSWYVGHTWSLSVEEQFYLLMPAVFLLAGKRRGLIAALVVIALCPLIRLLLYSLIKDYEIGYTFETVADSLAIGCILAGTRSWLHGRTAYQRLLSSKFFILVPVAVVLIGLLGNRPRIYSLIGFTLTNIGIVLCIDWCVTNNKGRIGKILNSRPLVFVGVMSYSIYLWQQLFLNRHSQALISAFPLNVMFTFLAALASYYLIEKPSLRWRQRLEVKLFPRQAPGKIKSLVY